MSLLEMRFSFPPHQLRAPELPFPFPGAKFPTCFFGVMELFPPLTFPLFQRRLHVLSFFFCPPREMTFFCTGSGPSTGLSLFLLRFRTRCLSLLVETETLTATPFPPFKGGALFLFVPSFRVREISFLFLALRLNKRFRSRWPTKCLFLGEMGCLLLNLRWSSPSWPPKKAVLSFSFWFQKRVLR